MPQNVTAVATFTDPVVAPTDGDARNAASVMPAFQALANRTKYTNDALTGLLATGASHVQAVADAAALRALTSHVNGDIAGLLGGNNGRFYIYDAASSLTDDGVAVVKPTDVGGGSGRWLNPGIAMLARANVWTSGQTCSAGLTASAISVTGGGSIASDGFIYTASYLECDGVFAAGGLATCNAGLTVNGGSGIECNAALDVLTTSDLHGAVHCHSSLDVDGAVSLGPGALVVAGFSTFQGSVDFDGVVDIAIGGTLSGPIACTDTGRVRKRRMNGADANTSYGINNADEITLTALSGNRIYTLVTTGAANGDTIRFVVPYSTDTETHTIAGLRDGGTVSLSFGTIRSVDVTFDGVGWYAANLCNG